jgi:hypothetical protein
LFSDTSVSHTTRIIPVNYLYRKFRSNIICEIERPRCPAIGKVTNPGKSQFGKVFDHQAMLLGGNVRSIESLCPGAACCLSHCGQHQFLDTAAQNSAAHQPGIAAPFVEAFVEYYNRDHSIIPEAIG